MSLLDRKLLRDICRHARAGHRRSRWWSPPASRYLSRSVSTYDSLRAGRDRFYAERALSAGLCHPQAGAALDAWRSSMKFPGVAAVEPRIVRDVIVDWPSAMLPVSARMVSLAHAGDEPLARLHLRRGTAAGAGRQQERRVNEAFAEAQRGATGRRCPRGAQRAGAELPHRRHRAVAGICLCGEAGAADSGRPLLCHAVG